MNEEPPSISAEPGRLGIRKKSKTESKRFIKISLINPKTNKN